MSVLGILGWLTFGGMAALNSGSDSADRSYSRRKAKERGDLTYYHKGKMYHVDTNRLCFHDHPIDGEGDSLVRDAKTGEILDNISESLRNERKKYEEEKQAKEERTIQYDSIWAEHWKSQDMGDEYAALWQKEVYDKEEEERKDRNVYIWLRTRRLNDAKASLQRSLFGCGLCVTLLTLLMMNDGINVGVIAITASLVFAIIFVKINSYTKAKKCLEEVEYEQKKTEKNQ